MAELTLGYRDFLGRPNLIILILKIRELSMASSRRENQKPSKHKGDSTYCCWLLSTRGTGELKELREDPG